MFRSDYSDYGSSGNLHSSLESEPHLSHSVSTSSEKKLSTSVAEDSSRKDFSTLFSKELTPNKRAVMEAMLSHWIAKSSPSRTSHLEAMSQSQLVSVAYSHPVQPAHPSSLHLIERHAS